MSRRVAVACAIGAALVFGVVAALAAFGDGSPAPSRNASVTGSGPYRGSEVPGGIIMRDFSLRNYDGRPVSSTDLAGRVTVLTFLDSQCTESCPVIAWTVARTIDTLAPGERQGVRAVAITTDPAEDTKRSVYSFLVRNRAVGRLLYLGGGESEHELRRVWDDFDVLSSLESGEEGCTRHPSGFTTEAVNGSRRCTPALT